MLFKSLRQRFKFCVFMWKIPKPEELSWQQLYFPGKLCLSSKGSYTTIKDKDNCSGLTKTLGLPKKEC